MMQGLSDIGKKNAEFAKKFLSYEGIRIVGSDLGGERGRRLHFWPVTGRARQSYMAVAEAMAATAPKAPSVARYVAPSTGDVDLF